MIRKMGPLLADHPCITDSEKCPACKTEFIAGDYVTLVGVGPGISEENRKKRDVLQRGGSSEN